MAFCSAVTLCFASIFSLVSAALLAIAFSTDNWKVIAVDRANLRVRKAPKVKMGKSLMKELLRLQPLRVRRRYITAAAAFFMKNRKETGCGEYHFVEVDWFSLFREPIMRKQ